MQTTHAGSIVPPGAGRELPGILFKVPAPIPAPRTPERYLGVWPTRSTSSGVTAPIVATVAAASTSASSSGG
jgi:hypothetical protein